MRRLLAIAAAASLSACSLVVDPSRIEVCEPRDTGCDDVVNTTRIGKQTTPALASIPGGPALLVWEDESGAPTDTIGVAIRGRVRLADGSYVESDLLVNSQIQGDQKEPDVAASIAGDGFLVVWEDSSGADDPSQTGIRGRLFDTAGGARGPDFPINAVEGGAQSDPAVVATAGGYLVVWEDASGTAPDTLGLAVRMQRLDAAGVRVGDELLVNTTTLSDQSNPQIDATSDGTVLVVWEDRSQDAGDPSGAAVRGRRVASDGSFLDAADFVVDTTTDNDQEDPDVVGLADGFLVAWDDSSGPPASRSDLRARPVPSTGTPTVDDFVVNTTTAGVQENVVLAAGPEAVLATWNDDSAVEPDTSPGAVRFCWLTAAGEPTSAPDEVLNLTREGDQGDSASAALADSEFLVLFEDESSTPPDTSQDAVRARFLVAP